MSNATHRDGVRANQHPHAHVNLMPMLKDTPHEYDARTAPGSSWLLEREERREAALRPIVALGPIPGTRYGVRQPITMGIPFPRGFLDGGARLVLQDGGGQPVALQTSVLARWSDGSVRWLLLDFILPANGGRFPTFPLTLAAGPVPHAPELGIAISEDSTTIQVATGPATFFLDKRVLRPMSRVVYGGEDLIDAAWIELVDHKQKRFEPHVETIWVENQGPVRATIRSTGTFPGSQECRFEARTSFYAGTGLVRFQLTVHNPRRARHRGGLWDLGDPGSTYFSDLSWRVRLAGNDVRSLQWSAEQGQEWRHARTAEVSLFQGSSGGANWQSANHVNRDGVVPCKLDGYRLTYDGREESGARASPTLLLETERGRVAAAMPEFWQQFPKAIDANDRAIRIGFFPEEFGDPFELQGGERKTHVAWLEFGRGPRDGDVGLGWVHRPATLLAPAGWYAASGAMPQFHAGGDDKLDCLLREAAEPPVSFLSRREAMDEYGWRHFGETPADHEAAYYKGQGTPISHYNNQYDVVGGALQQFVRTGAALWRELFDPLARHVMDIDVYHTTRDKASYNGGLFWFTDHYLDAATCTHRTYSRANVPADGKPYGGGPASAHNFTTGLAHYYYLTGDPLARDAVVGLAEWVMRMDDGQANVFGVVDDGPTGLASSTGDPNYHGPGRGAGNSVNALLDGWLLTGRQEFLDCAETLIRRCVHPADDVASLNLLDFERRWSYTVFLAALARYLEVKAEAGALDASYAYAQFCLLHYAEWMLHHERPYFDRKAEMEYPTEAWAGQELRKANVLRLAACHAEEPLRSALLCRGDELAERAWQDLMTFPTRTTIRSLALFMNEGMRDAWFRANAIEAMPRAAPPALWPRREKFVPQRTRILARLKSPGGLLTIGVRLANPWRWLRYARIRAACRASH